MKIPIRSIIRAAKGKLLLSFDLSQAEAWVVAYAANESTMKYELRYGDIHTKTARTFLDIPERILEDEERYVGKKGNHAFNYRMGPERCAEIINAEGIITVTIRQTKIFHTKYLELYHIQPWWLEIERKLQVERALYNYYGFRRNFHQQIGPDLYKEGTAFIPQSTIADHTYGALQEHNPHPGGLKLVHEQITGPSNGEFKLIHTAHDSGMIEFPSTCDSKELFGRVKSLMERPMAINGEEFTIPCDGKIGEEWEVWTTKYKAA